MSSPGLTTVLFGPEKRSPTASVRPPLGVSASHEELHRGFSCDLSEGVVERLEGPGHLLAVGGRRLYACQHAPVVGAVIAVVEEGDVPVGVEALQEAQQRAG